jgi:protein-tyrosine kinase
MTTPKASHLVERVAEKLLRSGSLDESAAQLLQSPGRDPDATLPPQALQGAPQGGGPESIPYGVGPVGMNNGISQAGISQAGNRGGGSRRSSLFAPPQAEVPAAVVELSTPSGVGVFDEAESFVGDIGTGIADLPRPSERPLLGGQADVQPAPTPTVSPAVPRPGAADPSGALQAIGAVDALALERAGMVDWSRTRSRISEEFRLVQRQILRAAFGPGAEPGFSNLLMVTSARPGEGKSFMSVNMAGSIARQGDNHVLLVDADSKRDSVCYSLGLAQSRGLLDLASNPKLDPGPLIVRTPIDKLTILPVGRERERSAELFSTKEMTRLIQSLGRRYADRLLILDAPPCLSTSDPALLAQVVGQILFVVEADRTQRDEVEASLDLIQACPTITLVLNKQQISSRYTFGAYSSYYSS